MTRLIDELNEMRRKAQAESGVWCGGISTSINHLVKTTGAKVIFDGKPPSDGCKATLCRANERVVLEQHWHGGMNSGDWWWDFSRP